MRASSLVWVALASCRFEPGTSGPIDDAIDLAGLRSCNDLRERAPTIGDGVFQIDPDSDGPGAPFETFCDMTIDGGGWTLVGKVDGRHDMYATWLVTAVDLPALASPTIQPDTFACANAVELAVSQSLEIRLTSSSRTWWVKWSMPSGRSTTTWWRHSLGLSEIAALQASAVTVAVSNGTTAACFQNDAGIMPHNSHGGSYPYASYNVGGSTLPNDFCMAVGTTTTRGVDGFDQNGNGFDVPNSEAAWPNPAYNIPAHVAVWLR